MTETLPMAVTAPFSRAQRATLFNLVRRAARAEIMPRFRNLDTHQITQKTDAMDLVTEADIKAEAMITRALQMAFPSAVIVGEEAAEAESDYRARLREAELGFLIDPVDGTWNFAHGIATFGTMLAACRFGRPVFGMIYDPIGQDVVWADLDTPSRYVSRTGTDQTLATRKNQTLENLSGYIELAFMPREHKRAAALACLDLRHFSTMRCSAHQYRLLVQGAVDFTLATKLNPWDHAAGVLICQQAGGHAAMMDGTPFDSSQDSGYLLSAGDETTWNVLADHFRKILE